jgi:hypothetical protein
MAIRAVPLLLCHLVYEDPVSHNMTLLGMFTRLRATRFPTPYRDISVYTLLTGDPGELGQLALQCIAQATGQVCAEETQRIQIGGGGKRHIHIRLGEVRFPEPGVYRFVLFFEDEPIAEQTIDVGEVA